MFQKAVSFAGTLLLTGAAVLMMPGPGLAAGHGGGGHFGGGHFAGGGHFGGAHYGGFRGGYGGAHYGYGRYHRYYGGYGYYPYYGLYGSDYPYDYDTAIPTYDSGYPGSYGAVAPDSAYGSAPAASDYQAFYPLATAPAEPDSVAHVTVKVPADAQLWFDDTLTTTTGTVRQFDTPPLAAGKYTYDVRARWVENGHAVTQTQHVGVTPGARVEVDFPVPPRALKKG
jgi:uncharacterized protein (TIGR03000 family)